MPKSAPTAGVLVGRDDELTIMRAALDAARSGRPSVVLVMGDLAFGGGSLFPPRHEHTFVYSGGSFLDFPG